MSEVHTIKEVMPTDRPELVIKMSDETFRIVGYEDLLKHKMFIPPREWKSFVFDAEKIQFKNGILLNLPFIVANAPIAALSALKHCALTIAQKHEGADASEYACVIKLYFFSETVLKPIYYKLGFSHLLVFQPPPTPPCKGGEFWKA